MAASTIPSPRSTTGSQAIRARDAHAEAHPHIGLDDVRVDAGGESTTLGFRPRPRKAWLIWLRPVKAKSQVMIGWRAMASRVKGRGQDGMPLGAITQRFH